VSVSRRLDRLDAALGKDHAGPEPLDVEQDLKIVLDFAANAKTNRHLEEFAALMDEVDHLLAGREPPSSIRGRLDWLRTARPAQLPPAPDWPTDEQLNESSRRLLEDLDREEWGMVDFALAHGYAAHEGRDLDDDDGTPWHRWMRLVGKRLSARIWPPSEAGRSAP